MNNYYISLSIKYDDGAIQVWHYDGAQFDTLEDLQSNMAADFVDPRMDRKAVVVRVTGVDGIKAPFAVPTGDLKEQDFVDMIYDEIEKRTTDGN